MKRFLKRDVPVGAAITIAALVLLASVVTGREDDRAVATVVAPAAATARPALADDLDLERLKRPKMENAPQDLFAPRSSFQAPAAPQTAVATATTPALSPPPSAPPLPFKYLGRMVDGGKVVVFLERNQDSLSAAAGDTLDNIYQVESIGESAVHFVYLPLGAKQALGIPAPY